MFVLHGGDGIGLGVAETGAHPLSVFRTVADREGFVVVYPGGLPASDGQEGWVDCRADDRASSNADDVGFLAALIEKVRTQYSLSPTRVFMAGGSNGAMMTQAFAIARPELVAAVASSGGALAANPRPGFFLRQLRRFCSTFFGSTRTKQSARAFHSVTRCGMDL